ncbi:peptidoglycan-binding domain-containing protein [Buchananella hordeovulneris]|uniref:peptidoglycan-binding domain-containing protein n=1 Tax=Buchananella hordeovulneris TaxID=52770 RepID=UPI000F5D582D|nr:hypothetical protein [Buchananella hordeovulneris]RRD41676.1 hypothetical protein EII13_10915 [Buchananella hordeovulneris]
MDGEIWGHFAELREHLSALGFRGGCLVFSNGDCVSSLVRALQTKLNRGGVNTGQVDGIPDPGTVCGLRCALEVEVDGYLGYNVG